MCDDYRFPSSDFKTWLQWKEMHTAACGRREKESQAVLHFILQQKRKTLHRWKSYISSVQAKKKSQGFYKSPVCLYYLQCCTEFRILELTSTYYSVRLRDERFCLVCCALLQHGFM